MVARWLIIRLEGDSFTKRIPILFVLLGLLLAVVSGCSANTATNAITTPTAPVSAAVVSPPAAPATIQYYFPRGGQQPDQALIKVINSAQSSLDIAIYSLTEKEIVNAIAADESRGVKVRLITDKTEAKNKYQFQELQILKATGIPIKVNTHAGLMHLKMTVADNKIATTGSYNYSNGATSENDEVLVVLNDPQAAQDFDRQFNRMWNDTADFADWQ